MKTKNKTSNTKVVLEPAMNTHTISILNKKKEVTRFSVEILLFSVP
jgi:hypothetical protein